MSGRLSRAARETIPYLWLAAVLIFGLFLLIYPMTTAGVVLSVAGTIFVIVGVVRIVEYFLLDVREVLGGWMFASGVVWILGGVLLYVVPEALIAFMPMLFGLALLVGGAVKLQGAFDLKRIGSAHWYVPLIGAALSAVMGVVIIVNAVGLGSVLMRVIGAFLIFEAAQDAVYLWTSGRARKEYLAGPRP
jgi:uncharacterized membrane protein HdeD (DUF308 family)